MKIQILLIILKNFENHSNCSLIELIKVDTSGINFPNIKNAHVTKATYYRILFHAT